jgi:predicted HicB family RNase H-like nuclease
MAITKNPKRNQKEVGPPSEEQAAEAFISQAGKAGPQEAQEAKKTPVMIRFDRELLKRVDTAAKRRGISRAAWVQFTLSRALDQGEG